MAGFFWALSSAALNPQDFDHVVFIGNIGGDLTNAVMSVYISAAHLSGGKLNTLELMSEFVMKDQRQTLWEALGLRSRILLVQMGDSCNLGSQSLEILNLFDRLERGLGWSVVRIAGNHEVLAYSGFGPSWIVNPVELLWEFGGSYSARMMAIRPFVSKTQMVARIGDEAVLFHGFATFTWLLTLANPSEPDNFVIDLNQAFHESLKVQPKRLFEIGSPFAFRPLDQEYCDSELPMILALFRTKTMIVSSSARGDLTSGCGGQITFVQSVDRPIASVWTIQRTQALNPTKTVEVLHLLEGSGLLSTLPGVRFVNSESDIDSQ